MEAKARRIDFILLLLFGSEFLFPSSKPLFFVSVLTVGVTSALVYRTSRTPVEPKG